MTVREELAAALKAGESVIRQGAHLNQDWAAMARAALRRHASEPCDCDHDTCPEFQATVEGRR